MKDIKDEVKKIIRSLLLSTKYGLTVNELCSEYTQVTCKSLPYKELGYYSAMDLIKDMSDVIRPVFMSGGVMLLKGIPDSSTAHICELVKRQKSTGTKTRIVAKQDAPKLTKTVVPYVIRSKLLELISMYPNGIDHRMFEKTYHNYYGRRLQSQLCGFPCLRSLLSACPDIIKMQVKLDQLFIYPASVKKTSRDMTKPRPLMESAITVPEQRPSIGISDETKQEIYTVLSKRSNGVWSARFPFEYQDLHKKPFDIQELGFNSVIELMSKLTDLVSIKRPVVDGDWILFAKGSEPKEQIAPSKTAYSLNSPGELDQLIEVYLSYIIDPTAFWFQCLRYTEKLDELMEEMNDFYHNLKSSDYNLVRGNVSVGQPCCGLYEDGSWYRCCVNKLISVNQVKVFYVDYGNEVDVHINTLRLLKAEFLTLPCQAMKGQLHNVKPTGASWSLASNKMFYELTDDKQLFGRIKKVDEATSLELIDTNGKNDVYIAEQLLCTNHALLVNASDYAMNGMAAMTRNNISQLQTLYHEYYQALNQVSNVPPPNAEPSSMLNNKPVELNPIKEVHPKNTGKDLFIKKSEEKNKVSHLHVENHNDKDAEIHTTDKKSSSALDTKLDRSQEDENTACNVVQQVEKEKNAQSRIKRISISGNTVIHFICYNNEPYITSAEISSLFWDGDILRQMLRQKGLQLTKEMLLKEENEELFSNLVQCDVKGVKNGDTIRSFLTVYQLQSMMKIYEKFNSKYTESAAILGKEIQLHATSVDSFWKCQVTEVEEEIEERRLQLQVLKFKRRRLHCSMMTNCASKSTVDELREIEKEIALLENS